MEYKCKTPVVLLMYNRPKHLRRTLEILRHVQPGQIFVVADGPREQRPGDAENCLAARAEIERIDWPCKIIKDYAEKNMGLAKRVSSGITNAFGQTERAIMIEDDCVPDISFFRYCDELLEKYEKDERVFFISGDNFQNGISRTEASYYFSVHNHCWGWASWARTWKKFDFEMKAWPQVKRTKAFQKIWPNPIYRNYWERIFEKTYRGQIDSWSYRNTFMAWLHGGLTALPNRNLVENIGFDSSATNTKDDSESNGRTQSLDFPLRHPEHVVRNFEADEYTQRHIYQGSWRFYRDALRSALRI